MKDSKMAEVTGNGAVKSAFKDAYKKLQANAETLREQREPDIDNLLTIVTESVAAYKVCKERIDAVERALEEALTERGAGQAAGDLTTSEMGLAALGGSIRPMCDIQGRQIPHPQPAIPEVADGE